MIRRFQKGMGYPTLNNARHAEKNQNIKMDILDGVNNQYSVNTKGERVWEIWPNLNSVCDILNKVI